ncbi:MAG: HlyD family type I secretion periplasmic adaptor subunit [Methyloceanibacter sp.]
MTVQSLGSSRRSIRGHLIAACVIGGILVVGLAGWARTTELAGAVIANGVVVVDSNVKKVQHPTGGLIGELRVGNDELVQAGEVLVRLDDTQTKANLGVFTTNLDELYARQARQEAEKEGADIIRFPDELLARGATDPAVAHILEAERKLFNFRAESREGQKAQLRERASQLREEVAGQGEQIEAKTKEIALIQEELKGVMELWQKQLVPYSRVTSLQRDEARLEGERGELTASKASSSGKIAEVALQIIQVDQDLRSKVAEELSDVRQKIAELSERKITAEDQLRHVDIRAPQTGRVHELAVHTVGGVISAGETLMLIVPENDTLSIEARVSPNDIDQVHPDQPVVLRFSAFNQRTTPQLNGTINWISPDLTQDQHTNTSYYTVRIRVSDAEIARLKGLHIIPGMPVETFIQTGERTVLSYLVKPLTDQIMRSFREG